MKNILFHSITAGTLTIFASLICSRGAEASLATDQTNKALAVIEGIPISAKEIAVPETTIMLQFRILRGHSPISAAETNDLENLAIELTNKRFLSKARNAVFVKKMASLGVSASNDEIQAEWSRLTNGVNFERAKMEQRSLIEPRLDALKAVYETGADKDVVFEKMLKGVLTKAEWEIDLQYYSASERRKTLEQYANQSTQDMSIPPLGIAAIVENRKMDNIVNSLIAKTDANFSNYLKLAVETNHAEIESKYPPNYLLTKQTEWWHGQYRKAAVVFFDDKYQEVWHDYINQ